MKLKNMKKWGAVAASACLALTSASAITLDVGLTDPYAVGDVVPGVDYGSYGGQANGDLAMINQLAGMALNGSASVSFSGSTYLYNRSGNFSSPMSAATLTGNVIASGGGINFDGTYAVITLSGTGFGYLVAKYDGPNGGAEVWNISGLAAGTTIKVPEYAFGQQVGQYQMTGWGLFNPTTPSVADGGTTMLLLGAALSGLGLLRRKLS
jgi:hypothetical protein